MSTPTCTRAWPARHVTKASRKSPTGSKPWPRRRSPTPAGSRRPSTPSRLSARPQSRRGPFSVSPALLRPQRRGRAGDLVFCTRNIAMTEGSLDAPTRHALAWMDPDFADPAKLDAEMRRVFDICHGCRRCFNLCDSFPRLFDLIDQSATGELDAVASPGFKPVVEACTLCDMCFMTKCPYVPPHEFALDFPHLMLRYRAAEQRSGGGAAIQRQLAKTDRNGKL